MSGAVIVRRITTAWRQIGYQRTRSSRQQAERAVYRLAEQILREEIAGGDAHGLSTSEKERSLEVSDTTIKAVSSTLRALRSLDLNIERVPRDQSTGL